MPASWRHRQSGRRKKLYRGRDVTGTKLPIGAAETTAIVWIAEHKNQTGREVEVTKFDQYFGSIGSVIRFDLRKQKLITQLETEPKCQRIFLTERAKVILQQIRTNSK